MALKAKVEWWDGKLSPENTIEAWATAATTTVILAVLLEEKLADEGGTEIEKESGGK